MDLSALRAACEGDQNKKIEVRRAWLSAVLKELEGYERLKEVNTRPANSRPPEPSLEDILQEIRRRRY